MQTQLHVRLLVMTYGLCKYKCRIICGDFFIYKLVDADRDEIVFLRNATVGNNTIIKSVVSTLKPGDSILTLSVAYGKGVSNLVLYVFLTV